MAASAAAQAVSRKIRTRRTSTTRRDSPSANVARSAPKRSGTRSPQARDEAASDEARPTGLGEVRIEAHRGGERLARERRACLPRARGAREASPTSARSVMRRISIFWACLRISSTLARASGLSPSSCAASQPNHCPRTSFRNAVSVGFTGRDEDLGTRGNRGEEREQGEKRRGGTPAQGHAALRRRRGPGGPQPRLAAGGGTGGFGFGAPASRVNTSWSSPSNPSSASDSSKESRPRVFSRSASSESTICRAPARSTWRRPVAGSGKPSM